VITCVTYIIWPHVQSGEAERFNSEPTVHIMLIIQESRAYDRLYDPWSCIATACAVKYDIDMSHVLRPTSLCSPEPEPAEIVVVLTRAGVGSLNIKCYFSSSFRDSVCSRARGKSPGPKNRWGGKMQSPHRKTPPTTSQAGAKSISRWAEHSLYWQ